MPATLAHRPTNDSSINTNAVTTNTTITIAAIARTNMLRAA